MTTIKELEHELWLETPKGLGYVLFVTDRGPNADIEWTCIIVDTREIWTVRTTEVKVAKNWTLGIGEQQLDNKWLKKCMIKPDLCLYCKLDKKEGGKGCPYSECPHKIRTVF